MAAITATERSLLDEARAADLAGAAERALALYLRVLAADSGGPSATRADVLRWVGNLNLRRGEYDEALAHYEASLSTAKAAGYPVGTAHALNCQAVAMQSRGEIEGALELYRKAAAEAAAWNEHRLLGMIEQNQAVVMSLRGEWDNALLRYRMSLRAFEEAKDLQASSWVLNNIGTLQRQRRQLADAEEAIVRARAIAEQCGDAWTMAAVELNYAELLVDLGQVPRAEALCERAIAFGSERNDAVHEAKALRCRARIFGQRARWTEAARDLEEALGLLRSRRDAREVAEILVDLAGVRRQLGHAASSVRHVLQEAREVFAAGGATHDVAMVDAQLGALEGPAPVPA